jgi:hypothetical protein
LTAIKVAMPRRGDIDRQPHLTGEASRSEEAKSWLL